MIEIEVMCPKCGKLQKVFVGIEFSGLVDCYECGREFQIPDKNKEKENG